MTRARAIVLVAMLLAGPGCSSILSPGGHCEGAYGLEACVPSLEFPPGADIVVTIENRSSSLVRLDACSIQLIGRPDPAIPFAPAYDPARRCARDATFDELLAVSMPVASGEQLQLDLRIPPGLFQGQYRYHFWFLGEAGELLLPEPLATAIFDVFPSADS